jgi:hypothetical protein
MGISPFMAFAKGAFEGYNQIQDEQRAVDAEIAIEQAKNGMGDNLFSNKFTTYDSNTGRTTAHFTFSDAKDKGARQEADLREMARVFTPEYWGTLSGEEQDQAMTTGVGLMQSYNRDNLITKDDKGQVVATASEHTFPLLLNHGVWQKPWQDVLSAEYRFDGPPAVNENVHVSVNKEGEIQSERIAVDGIPENIWVPATQKYAQQMNINPRNASAYFSKNHQKAIYMNEMFANPYNPNEPMSQVFARVATGGVINPEDADAIRTLVILENKNRDKADRITPHDIFYALELHSPSKYRSRNAAGENVTISNPKRYLEQLGFNIEDIRTKQNATFQAKKITLNIEDTIITHMENNNGNAPPQGTVLSSLASVLSAFTGKSGDVAEQLQGMGLAVANKFGVADDGAMDYVNTKWKETQKEIGSGVDEAAKTAAALDFYTTMLAYQLAVAIQGGTGGRTVSDQDVDNMYKAFGKRMFTNNTVQLSVLQEVKSFLEDIDYSTRFFTDTLNQPDLRGVNAANGFHKLVYGGVSAGDFANTFVMGERLEARINDVLPAGSERTGTGKVSGGTTSDFLLRNYDDSGRGAKLPALDDPQELFLAIKEMSKGMSKDARNAYRLKDIDNVDVQNVEAVESWLNSHIIATKK